MKRYERIEIQKKVKLQIKFLYQPQPIDAKLIKLKEKK